jgi:hypothetical protein
MALYKKEVVVRPNSTATYEQAITATRNFVNGFQNATSNSNGSGGFIDFFFADLFDARDGNIFRVFSDACATEYSMPSVNGLIKYDIVNNNVLASKTYVDDAIAGVETGGGEVDLTSINNTLADHEDRIVALEESGDNGAVAYVIE